MVRTLTEIVAAAKRGPYAWPMPDGTEIMIAQPTLNTERAAVKAATGAGTYPDGLLAGLRVYAGDDDGQKIADAYSVLPAGVLATVVADMRGHFTAPAE